MGVLLILWRLVAFVGVLLICAVLITGFMTVLTWIGDRFKRVSSLGSFGIFVCLMLFFAAAALELSSAKDEKIMDAYHRGYDTAVTEFEDVKAEAYMRGYKDGAEQAIQTSPRTVHDSYATSENLQSLNACVESVRQGDNDILNNSYSSWKEYGNIFTTLEDMFRGIEREVILEYFQAVYNLETELYPIDYFKERGYTYTGDIIEGWAP